MTPANQSAAANDRPAGSTHLLRMTQTMKSNDALNPIAVPSFYVQTITFEPQKIARRIE